MKEGVDALNLRAANEFRAAEGSAFDCVALDESIPDGTKIGISFNLGDNVANFFVTLWTSGWNDGVFILNFRFDSADTEAAIFAAGEGDAAFIELVPYPASIFALFVGVFPAIFAGFSRGLGIVFSDPGDWLFSGTGCEKTQPLFSNLQ